MDHQPANPPEPIDEERQRAYVALIDKLLLGARENANAILTAQRELVDEGLVEMMGRYAESMRQYGNQAAAAFLEDCGQQITAFLRQQADDGNAFSPSGEQEAFLIQLLQTTAASQGDPQVVYPLLQANLSLLNIAFSDAIEILSAYVGTHFKTEEDLMKSMQFQMKYIMPIITFFISYSLISVVGLYWFVSNLFALLLSIER
jgi:hypothetical protein